MSCEKHDLHAVGADAEPGNVIRLDFKSYYRDEDVDHFGIPVTGRIFRAAMVRDAIIGGAQKAKIIRCAHIESAIFSGDLDLENIVYEGFLHFEKCRFNGRVDFRHAAFRRLRFIDCVFTGPFEADVCEVYGDVIFNRCEFRAGLALPAAEIGGRFVLDDVDISVLRDTADGEKTHGRALAANMLVVKSGFFLRSRDPDWVSGALVRGTIYLDSASVDGNLELCGVQVCPELRDEDGNYTAIYLAGASLSGSLMLVGGCRIEGDIDAFDLRARLLVVEDTNVLRRNDKSAFNLEMAKVETYLTLGSGSVIGGINAASCSIGIAFYFGVDNKSNDNAGVDPAVFYEIDLTNSVIGRMEVDIEAWRQTVCMKFMDGASYRAICDLKGNVLSNIDGFVPVYAKPQVQRTVSQVLHDAGLDGEAAKAYIKFKNATIESEFARNTWGWLTDYGVGTAWPIIGAYLVHIVFFWLIYSIFFAGGGLCAPCAGEVVGPGVKSLAYGFSLSVDTAVPVAIGAPKKWEAAGPIWETALVIFQGLQWAVSWSLISLLVAYFSAAVWRKK